MLYLNTTQTNVSTMIDNNLTLTNVVFEFLSNRAIF